LSVGVRVSEIINLKIEDIDSLQMVIRIKQSKNNKDRNLPLSENVLNLLRFFFKIYKPKVYLFNGQDSLQYSAESCNQIVKKYFGKNYHFHQLRHSVMTELVNKGIDIRIIQQLCGHSSCKTTEVYTHVSIKKLSSIPLAI
jgi:integrase/recombinase XerD